MAYEYRENVRHHQMNYVRFLDYQKDQQGIFVDNVLVGLFNLDEIVNTLSISIVISPLYRNRGYASLATNKIVDEFGKVYRHYANFSALVHKNNIKSKGVMAKLGWDLATDGDIYKMLAKEGYEDYILFVEPNPYYEKMKKKKKFLVS